MKDFLLAIVITIVAFCRILVLKEFLLLTIIVLAILCRIWWLATLLSGIGLLLRSYWMMANPDAVWFETIVGCDCQGTKLERTIEWERSRTSQAIGIAAMGTVCLLLGVSLLTAIPA